MVLRDFSRAMAAGETFTPGRAFRLGATVDFTLTAAAVFLVARTAFAGAVFFTTRLFAVPEAAAAFVVLLRFVVGVLRLCMAVPVFVDGTLTDGPERTAFLPDKGAEGAVSAFFGDFLRSFCDVPGAFFLEPGAVALRAGRDSTGRDRVAGLPAFRVDLPCVIGLAFPPTFDARVDMTGVSVCGGSDRSKDFYFNTAPAADACLTSDGY